MTAEEFVPRMVALCPYCLAMASEPGEAPPCDCPRDYLDDEHKVKITRIKIGGVIAKLAGVE